VRGVFKLKLLAIDCVKSVFSAQCASKIVDFFENETNTRFSQAKCSSNIKNTRQKRVLAGKRQKWGNGRSGKTAEAGNGRSGETAENMPNLV